MNVPGNAEITLISIKEATQRTSLSRTMLNRLRAQGRFPQEVPLGDRRFAFVKAEVDAWINERASARKARPTIH